MPPLSARRFATFVAASFALHALTLVSIPPAGVAGASYSGPARPEPLHAVLVPAAVATSAPAIAHAAEAAEDPSEPATPERAGSPGGADLPLPDRWYSSAELDVRAEPTGEVPLDYPEELDGSGLRGRVQLLLFIDERGVVRRMRVTESEPPKLFDKAAMRAWVGVRFTPARKNGTAVKSQKLLEVEFIPPLR